MHRRKKAPVATSLFVWFLLLTGFFSPFPGFAAEFSFLLMSESGSDASVVITSQIITNRGRKEENAGPILAGDVINRSEKTAHKVWVIYQVFDIVGKEVAKGMIRVNPNDIPSKGLAHFWGPLPGVKEATGLTVKTKVVWSF